MSNNDPRPKRGICHVITGLGTGGAEQSLYLLLKGEVGSRYENRVISLTGEGKYTVLIKELGIPVSTLNLKRRPWNFFKLFRRGMFGAPDIIQGWMYHGNLAAWVIAWRAGVRKSLFWSVCHSLDRIEDERAPTALAIRLNRILSAAPLITIYPSSNSLRTHLEFGFCAENAVEIPNGVDCDIYQPLKEGGRGEIQGLPRSNHIVLHVGRFHEVKDHPNLIDAFSRLVKVVPDAKLVCVGPGVDYNNYSISKLIDDDLRKSIHLLGEREDIPSLMAASDVFVLSSYSEAFGYVVCEAMACGVPAVSTGVGDCEKMIGDTGYIVPPKDPSALAKALSVVLLDPQLRKRLGGKARERILKEYNLNATETKFCDTYDALYEPDR